MALSRASSGQETDGGVVVNVQFSQATFSGSERKQRPHGDRKSIERALQLEAIFRAVILPPAGFSSGTSGAAASLVGASSTALIPTAATRFQVDIYIEVLASDGDVLSESTNAATLALVHAGVPLLDLVCGMSVALSDGRPLVDATHAEINSLGLPCLCIACLPNTRVACDSADDEENARVDFGTDTGGEQDAESKPLDSSRILHVRSANKLHSQQLRAALSAALSACQQLSRILDEASRSHLERSRAAHLQLH